MPEEVSKEALKPCPFCGGRDLRPCGNGDGGQWLTCDSCSADGPYAHSDEEQNRLWNTRSPSALSVGEEDALAAWVAKIALEGEVAAKDGLEFGDLVRAFRAGFRAAIAAMNGGGE